MFVLFTLIIKNKIFSTHLFFKIIVFILSITLLLNIYLYERHLKMRDFFISKKILYFIEVVRYLNTDCGQH